MQRSAHEKHVNVFNKAQWLMKHSAARALRATDTRTRSRCETDLAPAIQSMQRHLRLSSTCENMCSSLRSVRTTATRVKPEIEREAAETHRLNYAVKTCKP